MVYCASIADTITNFERNIQFFYSHEAYCERASNLPIYILAAWIVLARLNRNNKKTV